MSNQRSAIAIPKASVESGNRFKLKRVSVSQQIHDALRERIISLELKPGQNLSRIEIADHYGVSQTPVRDAMLKLEEEGLLIIHPQSKTEVSKIDIENARETQFLRLSIELEIVRQLARIPNPQQLAPIEKTLTSQENALAEGDLERFALLDRMFHRAMYEATNVANLCDLVASRSGHIDRLRNLNLPDPGKPKNILQYHRSIVANISNGLIDKAEQALRDHLSGTLSQLDQIIAKNPGYF